MDYGAAAATDNIEALVASVKLEGRDRAHVGAVTPTQLALESVADQRDVRSR